jgi:dienelactone hydrolase
MHAVVFHGPGRKSWDEVAAPCPTLVVAGERETHPPVRVSNAALAALMPNARARFVAGPRHGWIGELPDIHLRMLRAWFAEQELPSDLLPETAGWDRCVVDGLVGRNS